MASIIDQIGASKLSLEGNGFNPQQFLPDWGYIDSSNNLDPAVSKLQYTYSVDSNPIVRLVDYNKNGVSTVKEASHLDELDVNAPNNNQAGAIGSVVSQIYKSQAGKTYKDLGPQEGIY